MKLCKACAESAHEMLQGGGDHSTHISHIADAIREALHPPAPEPKPAKKAKAEASESAPA